MEMTMQLSRTVKGQDEIFNLGHTLRPRHRQLLFCIGNGISFGELCKMHPKCVELESMVNELLQNGFIQTFRNLGTSRPTAMDERPARVPTAVPPTAPADDGLHEAQAFVLDFMAALVGTKSPAYRQMSEIADVAGFRALLPRCSKVIAAVASPHQAAEMEAGATQRLVR
jgi:hypothetical protein